MYFGTIVYSIQLGTYHSVQHYNYKRYHIGILYSLIHITHYYIFIYYACVIYDTIILLSYTFSKTLFYKNCLHINSCYVNVLKIEINYLDGPDGRDNMMEYQRIVLYGDYIIF